MSSFKIYPGIGELAFFLIGLQRYQGGVLRAIRQNFGYGFPW